MNVYKKHCNRILHNNNIIEIPESIKKLVNLKVL